MHAAPSSADENPLDHLQKMRLLMAHHPQQTTPQNSHENASNQRNKIANTVAVHRISDSTTSQIVPGKISAHQTSGAHPNNKQTEADQQQAAISAENCEEQSINKRALTKGVAAESSMPGVRQNVNTDNFAPQILAVGAPATKQYETGYNFNPQVQMNWKQTATTSAKIDLLPVKLVHGEPTIEFTIDEVNEFTREEGLHQAVVVKFSYGKPELHEFRQIFPKQFGIKGCCNIGQLEFRHLLIRFDLYEDYVQFLSRSTGYVKAKAEEFFFRTFPWTLGFNPREETSTAAVWISFPELPPNFFAKKSLLSIASTVGKPLAVDKATKDRTRPSAARVKVLLDLLDKHPSKVKLLIIDKITGKTVEFYQQIVYDNLPKYCTFCKHQGHEERSCRVMKGKSIIVDKAGECELNIEQYIGDARQLLNAKRAGQNKGVQQNDKEDVDAGDSARGAVSSNAAPGQNDLIYGVRPIVVKNQLVDVMVNTSVEDRNHIVATTTDAIQDTVSFGIHKAGDDCLTNELAVRSTGELELAASKEKSTHDFPCFSRECLGSDDLAVRSKNSLVEYWHSDDEEMLSVASPPMPRNNKSNLSMKDAQQHLTTAEQQQQQIRTSSSVVVQQQHKLSASSPVITGPVNTEARQQQQQQQGKTGSPLISHTVTSTAADQPQQQYYASTSSKKKKGQQSRTNDSKDVQHQQKRTIGSPIPTKAGQQLQQFQTDSPTRGNSKQTTKTGKHITIPVISLEDRLLLDAVVYANPLEMRDFYKDLAEKFKQIHGKDDTTDDDLSPQHSGKLRQSHSRSNSWDGKVNVEALSVVATAGMQQKSENGQQQQESRTSSRRNGQQQQQHNISSPVLLNSVTTGKCGQHQQHNRTTNTVIAHEDRLLVKVLSVVHSKAVTPTNCGDISGKKNTAKKRNETLSMLAQKLARQQLELNLRAEIFDENEEDELLAHCSEDTEKLGDLSPMLRGQNK